MKASWCLLLATFLASSAGNAVEFLEDRFELPAGFRVYRVAGPEVAGGSYDLCFDPQGRLLVGDGNAVRRLTDKDGDGVYDSFEVIANGLGPRGPQGLLVVGDLLYAVGGDGLQVFEGYTSSGQLKHRGRVGNKFNTGGDHDLHTILRGHDGHLYLMAGNGSGVRDRLHITESNSPARFEREASVFRISPEGKRWECIASGGRNPPSLGMNYLGELFSFDSDMEWHVGLPWYRPVRLNHWLVGGDQGWQEVGAYPPYYIDCLPGILDVGRASPNWGVFYEHTGLPAKYHDAFLVCDYRWKRESNDQYATTGRLVAFFLKRYEAGWKASMEVVARPKPGARDAAGKLIQFALVDIDVAPDGSLFVSDHNQGIWRIIYGDAKPSLAFATAERVDPGGMAAVLDPTQEIRKRLRALRELSPDFSRLDIARRLALDPAWEMRAQAAWIFGIQGDRAAVPHLAKLLKDSDPFVRRRAAEALTRLPFLEAIEPLIAGLADPARLVRYASMVALTHHASANWLERVVTEADPQPQLRGLAAAKLRGETVPPQIALAVISRLTARKTLSVEDELDLLRVIALLRSELTDAAKESAITFLRARFPASDVNLRWEQARLLGEFGQGFTPLLRELERERDHVTQFHLAQAISKVGHGWSPDEEQRLLRWFLQNQQGWFAQFAGKGVEFPMFWQTVLTDFAAHHREALLASKEAVDYRGLLGAVTLDLIAKDSGAAEQLVAIYGKNPDVEARRKILRAMKEVRSEALSTFLIREANAGGELRTHILLALSGQPVTEKTRPLLLEGLASANPEIVRSCTSALGKADLDEHLARAAVSQLLERTPWFHSVERLLLDVSGVKPPGFEPPVDANRRPAEAQHRASVRFWKDWYARSFGKPLEPPAQLGVAEKSDEEIHAFLLSERAKGGDGTKGARVYEMIQCNSCHGGGVTPGREGKFFGPDLAGIGRRLSRTELADALVYPSKQVADRFKAVEVDLTDATPLTGFITEQNDAFVTLADREQVHRLPRAKIRALTLQKASLMPERLINGLSWDELRDLLAFLEEGSK